MTLPIILALDTKDIQQAKSWIKASSNLIDHFKVGLEFYLKHGFLSFRRNPARLFLPIKTIQEIA